MTSPTLLRQLAQRGGEERCELCGVVVPAAHPHLAEPAGRSLVCSCRPCALLFSRAADTRYRLVPETVVRLSDFELPDDLWESLLIPVEMAYFFFSTPARRVVALYPGPAGTTESQLALESWRDLEAANPVLGRLQPDVEGLLVYRVGANREHFIAPIDRFYELVGVMRLNWHGLAGGTEVWREVRAFFDRLGARAVGPTEARGGA